MKKLVAITGVAAGLLLMVVPRYVLPPCEHGGFAGTHCSDTARAEVFLGALVLAAGALALDPKRRWVPLASAAAACILLGVAWFMPDVTGYCPSPRMPCHYGMVPGVRFIAALAAVVLIPAAVLLGRDLKTKRDVA
jgi:hypothetical protein